MGEGCTAEGLEEEEEEDEEELPEAPGCSGAASRFDRESRSESSGEGNEDMEEEEEDEEIEEAAAATAALERGHGEPFGSFGVEEAAVDSDDEDEVTHGSPWPSQRTWKEGDARPLCGEVLVPRLPCVVCSSQDSRVVARKLGLNIDYRMQI